MNKNRLNQIVRVLLLPYCGRNFEKENGDVIKNIRKELYDYICSLKKSRNAREKAEKDYVNQVRNLERYIRSDYDLRAKTIDDIKLLIELFYPEDEILTLMEKYENPEVGIERYYLKNIFRIAESLLTFRDGKIAIRTWMNPKETEIFQGQDIFDKVEIWNILSRIMVPDIFIVAFFITAQMNKPYFLYNQNGGITLADKVLDRVLIKGFAETHMHMNAGVEYSVYWQGIMSYAYWQNILNDEKAYENKAVEPYIFFYRILFAAYLRKRSEYKDFLHYVEVTFNGQFMQISKILNLMYMGESVLHNENIRTILEQINIVFIDDANEFFVRQEFLIQTIYRMERIYKTSSEMIFLMETLDYLQQDCSTEFELRLFLQYLRAKNRYFSEFIQNGYILGLNNFRHYFGAAMNNFAKQSRINQIDAMKVIFKSQSHNVNLKKIELRISPPVVLRGNKVAVNEGRLQVKKEILKRVQKVLKSYIVYIEEMTGEHFEQNRRISENMTDDLERCADQMYESGQCAFPVIGIVFHFIKTEYLDNRIGDMCWFQYSEDWEGASKHLLVWRKKLIECAQCIEELRSSIPYLAEYIVGIDAASEENSTEPWIMSAVYKAVRNKNITKALIQDKKFEFHRIDNMGFTYHVGEEFRHILSGLRHIDEVIEEFNYKAGDRLGHAIALGEDIKLWIKNNEVVTVPAMEWMENLLWLWGNIVQDKMKVQVSATYLEGKIMELAQDIYGDSEGMTPLMLYQAYKSKFLIEHLSIFEKQKKCVKYSQRNPEMLSRKILCKYYVDDKEQQRWSKEKIVCTFFCPIYNMRFRKPILIRTAENIGEEVLDHIQKYFA